MSKKKTTEEFVEESKKVHGNKYDYSKVNYINNRTKICIVCPEHGEFWQTPGSHLNNGNGCPLCGNKNCSEKKLKSINIFIKQAKEIHGDKYDYSKVEYSGNHEKVIIICPEHGEFLQSPDKHLQGCGCPKCAGNVKSNAKEFIEKSKKIHGNKYDYSKVEYINCHTNVCIICPEHGEFWQTPSTHLRGNGCSKCSGKAKSNTEEFIKKAQLIHGNKYDYSETVYIAAAKKVKIICPLHGEFYMTGNNHLRGQGCPKCAGNIKLTTEEFINKAKDVHGDKYNYSKVNYINRHTEVCIICPECGEFQQTPNSHLAGNGCPKCKGWVFNTEDFIDKAKKVHGDKYDYSKVDYKTTIIPVCIICPKHGEFLQKPNKHLCGYGCPKCTLKSQNKLFEKLKEVLQEDLVWEYTTDWLEKQRIDIFIPKYNIGIEYHGIQHYEPVQAWGGEEELKLTQQRDSLKLEKCNNHGIKLLYLKYDYSEQDFENLIQDIHKIIEDNT